MKRLLAWIGGVLGGIAAYRWLRGRPQVAAEPSPEPDLTTADARAEKLRAKLEETRAAEPAAEEPAPEPAAEEEPAPEPAAEEEPAAEPESPEDRRRRVHEEGRAALDDMKSE